jgi:hypothetical protein
VTSSEINAKADAVVQFVTPRRSTLRRWPQQQLDRHGEQERRHDPPEMVLRDLIHHSLG